MNEAHRALYGIVSRVRTPQKSCVSAQAWIFECTVDRALTTRRTAGRVHVLRLITVYFEAVQAVALSDDAD